MVSYRSKAEYIALFEAFAQAYPNIVKSETIPVLSEYGGGIGHTVNGNTLHLYRVGNPQGGKIFIDGEIHGQSFVSSELLYLLLKWLLESGEADATRILQRNCILFLPIINYDSWNYNNMNGVNLNRNFPINWGETGSPSPGGEYRGPGPASEPETQAVVSIFVNEKPFFYINHHNWGGPYITSKYANPTQQAYQNSIYPLYVNKANARGITDVYSDYRSVSTSGGGGLASTDASLRGINGWIWETCSWGIAETLANPPSIDKTTNFYFPRWLPMIIAMCQACETTIPPPEKHMLQVRSNLSVQIRYNILR